MGYSPVTIKGKSYWKFQYRNVQGEPKIIYLDSKLLEKDVKYISEFLEKIVEHSKNPASIALPAYIQEFIDNEVDYKLQKKLVDHGLIPKTEKDLYEAAVSIKALADKVEAKYRKENEHTYKNMKLACSKLIEYFGDTKKVIEVTKQDVEEFNFWLYSKEKSGYVEATASRLTKRFKQIGDIGIDLGLIEINPFKVKELEVRGQSNKARVKYVEKKTVDQVISVCETPELRFALFLSRYCGFRVPVECNRWKWSFIRFPEEKVLIHAKMVNRRIVIREIPLFPFLYDFFKEILIYYGCDSFIKNASKLEGQELQKHLKEYGDAYINEMVDKFPQEEDFVFSPEFRKRKSRTNQIKKLLKKAKVSWIKSFHNLRASVESDWIEEFGLKAACEWIGNSMQVCEEHYAMITSDASKKALGRSTTTREQDAKMIRQLLEKYGKKGFEELLSEVLDEMG